MRSETCVIFALLPLLLAARAAAEELTLGWRFEGEYDSEATSANGGEDDESFEFGPVMELKGDHRRWRYTLMQSSRYEKYVKLTGLDDWRHEVTLNSAFDLTKHVTLVLNERFTDLPRIQARTDADISGGEDVIQNLDRNPVFTNSFSASLRTNLAPRLAADFSVSHFWRSYKNASFNAQDTSSFSTVGQTNYQLTENHSIGAGFRFSRRDFKTDNADKSNNDVYEAFATWNWTIDPRTTFSARVGPAWSADNQADLQTNLPRYATVIGSPNLLADPTTCDQNISTSITIANPFPPPPTLDLPVVAAILDGSCQPIAGNPPLTDEQARLNQSLDPVFIPGVIAGISEFEQGSVGNQTNVNVFFSLGLQRRWDRMRLYTNWSRTDSQTQSLGANTTLDSFLAGGSLDFDAKTSFTLDFRFTRREADSEASAQFPVIFGPTLVFLPDELPGVIGTEIAGALTQKRNFKNRNDVYSVRLQATRDWGRSSNLFAGVIWRRQEQRYETDFLQSKSSREEYEITFGFNYRFHPIRVLR